MTPPAPLRRYPRVTLLVLVLLLSGGLLAWRMRGGDPAGPAAAAEQQLVVQRQPFVATLAFAGRIVPGSAVSVVAPFDGRVRTLGFAFGDRVAAGQPLLTLETDEVLAARNEAEAAYLKARRPVAQLAAWRGGPEVAQAERRAELARLELAQAERRAAEGRRLLEKGLIARNEQEGLEQQLHSLRMALAGARGELAGVLAQGDADAVRAAQLELANARGKLALADRQIGEARVLAPATGVIVRAELRGLREGGEAPLDPGSRVARGQLIGTIARDGGLAVRFEVEEGDVNALAPGQAVSVSGPGFAGLTLSGRIATVAAESAATSGPASQTRFVATASLDPLPPEQAGKVRLGMTAAATVITYQRPAAIVVPPPAIEGAAPATSVRIRTASGRQSRTVKIGRVTATGVEILSGLRPGETIVWREAPPPAAPPPSGGSE